MAPAPAAVTLVSGGAEADAALMQSAQKYLADKGVSACLSHLLTETLLARPADPLQFLVDVLTFADPALAEQDKNGLSAYRRQRLRSVFLCIDKNDSGQVEFSEIQAHINKSNTQVLSTEDLQEIFKDLDTSGDNEISIAEFYTFFARAFSKCSNADFDTITKEMMD
eukprot:jgi/Chlat1/4909/Chrsp31S04839